MFVCVRCIFSHSQSASRFTSSICACQQRTYEKEMAVRFTKPFNCEKPSNFQRTLMKNGWSKKNANKLWIPNENASSICQHLYLPYSFG